MQVLRAAALMLATLTTGVMAGLFFAFTFSVMPGLARAGDRTFVDTMQRINVAIVNGWFLVCFFGALGFTVIAAVLHLSPPYRSALPWIVAAAVLYLAVLIITVTVNIPLNNQLAAAGPIEHITEPYAVRAAFEATWVRWNAIRTIANLAAFGCLAWALALQGRVSG